MVKLIRQWASKVKRTVLGDQVVRRMPLWYNPALHMLDTLSVVSIEERRAFGEVRLRHILQAAQKTAYGRQCGGGLQLSTWPLLS
jgi:hypothetical protein